MPNIGPLELAIVLVIVLLLFGAKRLPELGRSLGSGMKEFKDSVTSGGKDDDDDERDAKQLDPPDVQPEPAARTGESTVEAEPR